MARFRIYYHDGTTYTDGVDGDEFSPPWFGVICILQKRGHDKRYHVVSGTPNYIFVDNEWLPAWDNDIKHRLFVLKGTMKNAIEGLLTTKEKFNEVYEQAKQDRNDEVLD